MSKYCGYCDLQVEYCECGNVDHTKPREKPMSKKMIDIKWSDARKIEHVWIEDLEDPSLSAFCEEDGGVYFVVETCESMGNFSDVEEGILRVYRNPELLQLENDSLTEEVERLREALSEVMASIGGGKKKCGHDFTCVCAEDAARKALEDDNG